MSREKVVEYYNCRINSLDILSDNEDFPSISKDRGNRIKKECLRKQVH